MRFISDFWVDRAWLDWLILAVVLSASAKWGMLKLLPTKNPESILQIMNAVAIGMIGLGSVVATLIVTSTPSERLKKAIEESRRELVGQIFGCIFVFIVCIVFFLLPFLEISWLTYQVKNGIFVLTMTLLILRSTRLLVLLRLFLHLLV